MNKKAFTLIELLSVIVILAIIALIATPIILNLIEDSKKNAFKESINGVVRAANIKSTNQVIEDHIEYKYESGKWEDLKLEIDGSIPKYVQVRVNKEGNTRYAITDGKYCIIKEYDGNETVKRIGNENTDKVVEERYCVLDAVIGTTSDCFEFDSTTGTITKYYSHEQNNSKNNVCPKDVMIPNKIGGVDVKIIGASAFYLKKLTNVEIPDTVTKIMSLAFRNNYLKDVIISEGVQIIEDAAFDENLIENLSLPTTLTSIAYNSFSGNKLPQDQAYIYKRNEDGSIDYSTIIGYGGTNAEGGKNIKIPSEKNGVKLTTIGGSAFYNASLTNVIIPNSIINIKANSFRLNSLSEVIIPESVISIESAFLDNPLTSVTIKNKRENVTLNLKSFGTFDINNINWDPEV